jgi:uncharacterized protein YdhG (YjbR/CyaY superfamily)
MKNEIDKYISGFPSDVKKRLERMRAAVREAAPLAEETMKYRMPTFVLHGNLVHFAAFANHIGFYPVPTGIEAYKKELAPYKQGKGSVQFPHDKPLPLELVKKIVRFRVKENAAKADRRKKEP